MKIAVMATGCDVNSTVAEAFADAQWLLIADVDKRCICEAIPRSENDAENTTLARIIVERDCESVICGEIEKEPFDVLADRGVTRSLGSGLNIVEALNCESMLELITDHIDGPGCPSHQHEAEHCCGEHGDHDDHDDHNDHEGVEVSANY